MGVVLLRWCLLLCPLSPREAFVFDRFIVSLSFIVLSLSLSNHRNTFDTILSFLYRTILSKVSTRYPTLVYYLLFLFVFLLTEWGHLPLQSYWSLSCNHGLHCTRSDELMWEQYNNNNNNNNNNNTHIYIYIYTYIHTHIYIYRTKTCTSTRYVCCVCCFFFTPFNIFALLFSLPSSRNSDPGSHSRLFSPHTHYGSCLAFLSWQHFSPFFPRRLASNCAYPR